MPQKRQEVLQELHQIHFQRSKNVWVFHSVLIAVSLYFQRTKIFSENFWWVSVLILGIGLGLRSYLVFVKYDEWRQGTLYSKIINYLGLILTAIGWAVHFWAIVRVYGADSYNASHTLLTIAGIIAGAAVTSAAHKKSFHAFSLTLCLLIFGLYYLAPSTADNSTLIYIAIFYSFTSYNLNIGNKQLRRSLDNEVEARREKIRVTRIIDTVPGSVSVYDKDLVCVLANEAMLAYYPDIIGKQIGAFEKNSNWEQSLKDFLNSDKMTAVQEAPSNVGGKARWSLRNYHRSVDDGVVFVSIEITELITARNRLREQEAKAHYSAKLASLGEMAAGIAHEINNPLTIILGSVSVIQKLVEQEPMDRKTIHMLSDKLIRTADRISKTIKSLKALSRNGENDPFEEVNFAQVLDQCLDICRQRCELHSIKLKMPDFSKPVLIRAREVQLSQVLMNLLSNAMDAVKNVQDPWIEVTYYYSDDALDIFVSDSGPGVPEEIRNKIMDPFFTTKEVNQGTGLGLSISKTIMQSHKGELTLMEGTHTTFRMHLPNV